MPVAAAFSACSRAAGPSPSWRARPPQLEKTRCVLCRASSDPGRRSSTETDRVTLRSEAEAPWRLVRLVIFGFSAVSAGVGTLTSIPQLLGALGGARNALPLADVGQNLVINISVMAICGFLLQRDLQARDRQIARLGREEALAGLKVQLANGKRLRLGDLQGTARVVLVAGDQQQVEAGLAAAEPFKEELLRRGVFVVGVPVYGQSAAAGDTSLPGSIPSADLRWRGTPLKPDRWRAWFDQQLSLTKSAVSDNGLYVGLRLDGRVRASGMGVPPWARFAAELAPLEGDNKWTGFFDGFDGKV